MSIQSKVFTLCMELTLLCIYNTLHSSGKPFYKILEHSCRGLSPFNLKSITGVLSSGATLVLSQCWQIFGKLCLYLALFVYRSKFNEWPAGRYNGQMFRDYCTRFYIHTLYWQTYSLTCKYTHMILTHF